MLRILGQRKPSRAIYLFASEEEISENLHDEILELCFLQREESEIHDLSRRTCLRRGCCADIHRALTADQDFGTVVPFFKQHRGRKDFLDHLEAALIHLKGR